MTKASSSPVGNRIASVALVLSLLVVLALVHDALTAIFTKAPTFLFTFLLPSIIGGGRFASLAATLALPALAVGLPVLTLLVTLLARTKAARAQAGGACGFAGLLAGAAVLLCLGLVSDVVLYRTLGAIPEQAGPQTEPVRQRTPQPPQDVEGDGPNGETERGAGGEATGEEWIVFASDRSGDWELWAMKPDGSEQVKVSRTERIHMQPRFSPDGTRVVFSSRKEDGTNTVYIMNWADANETEVTTGDQASFTGDGEAIIFRREGKVWLRNLDSGKEKLVSPSLWSRCSFPSFSPVGRRVAFASRLLAGYNVYVLGVEGGEPKVLVGGEGACDPRWSPSGKQLSFQSETHIFAIKPDGSGRFQVTIGAGVQHYATWSPDETRMAYCQGPGPQGPWQIYVVSLVEDTYPERLTSEGSNIYPDWQRVPTPPLPPAR